MKCNNCGKENENKNKFCKECGTKLNVGNSLIECPSCKSKNKPDSKFCMDCGSKLEDIQTKKSKSISKYKSQKGKKLPLIDLIEKNKFATVAVLTLIIFIVIRTTTSKDEQINNFNRYQAPVQATLLSPKVNEIASKFICSCGTCGELPLEECTCPVAREEKELIQKEISSGKTNKEIIKIINKRYGWIKPQYKTLLTKEINKTKKNNISVLEDLNLIASNFVCPCGKCGMDDLSKCSCDHPRGAKEVKQYITNLIKEKKYSVDKIIDRVSKKYGSRKSNIRG